jgi:hypothetical protein
MKINRLLFIFTLTFVYISSPGQGLCNDTSKTITVQISKTDTVLKVIESLKIKSDQINEKVKNQSSKIETLINQGRSSQFHYFKDFIYPILLSVIAGVIFWLIFSFLPERKRLKRLRPKLDLDMYEVYSNLFSVFDLAMRPNSHSPSNFQQEIRGNKLTGESGQIDHLNPDETDHL